MRSCDAYAWHLGLDAVERQQQTQRGVYSRYGYSVKIMESFSKIHGGRSSDEWKRGGQALDALEIRLIHLGQIERLAKFAKSPRLHAADPLGNTPLHLAAGMGNIALCDLFVLSGASPALMNKKLQLPADVALANGHTLLAELLSSLVSKSPQTEAVDGHQDVMEVKAAQSGGTLDSIDDLDEVLHFEAEQEPQKFSGQYTVETASGRFFPHINPNLSALIDNGANWELDLSSAKIVGEGIGSSVPVAADRGTDNDFLKVRNRGRQSVKRAIIQTGTRLSISPEICKIWAEETLAKGWCSFDDIDRLVAHCQGNGDLEELRTNLHRNLEVAGFEIDQANCFEVGLSDVRSDISADDLAESIEAALTRGTRLPGTKRFIMDRSVEQQLLEPMVRAKQELQLGILASDVAIETILDALDNIREGLREPNSVSLRTIIPSRPGHSQTAEFMAAVESLRFWQANGRVMDGKRRREALVALDALEFSLAFHKELIRTLEQDPACEERAIQLGGQILIFEAVTERLIQEHLPYVRRFAARNVEKDEEPEDVFQVAFIGLQRATRRFDPERGYRFLIYATYWMRQSIARWRADEGAAVRVPVHRHENLTKLDLAIDKLGIRSAGMISDNDLASELHWTPDRVRHFRSIPREAEYPDSSDDWDALLPEHEGPDAFDQAQTERVVANAIAELQDRRADIIRMRFGIGGNSEMTLEEVGHAYGLTRERIRQIEAKTVRLLRHSTRLGRFAYLLEK